MVCQLIQIQIQIRNGSCSYSTHEFQDAMGVVLVVFVLYRVMCLKTQVQSTHMGVFWRYSKFFKLKASESLCGLYYVSCCDVQESGPQLLLQLHIVLCTGNIGGLTQQISIIISFVSLTVAACRAFYVQRDPARADAEPTLHMMIR